MKTPLEKSRERIQKFCIAKVLVFGDVILDSYLDCKALGVANEAPVPLLQISRQTYSLGGAASVAHNLARLGVQTELVGRVGKDLDAEILTSLLKDASITFYPLTTNRSTTRKTRVHSDKHYYLRIDEEEASALTDQEVVPVLEMVKNSLRLSSLIVVSDYDKGIVTAASASGLESLARDYQLKILADLKPQNMGYWRHLDLITPNRPEARALHSLVNSRSSDPLDEPGLAKHLSQALACDVVLKLANQGMLVASKSGEVTRFPALCRIALSASGAGDTVLSTLAAAIASGAPLEEAAYLANVAASIAVSHPGTYAVSAEELIRQLEQLSA